MAEGLNTIKVKVLLWVVAVMTGVIISLVGAAYGNIQGALSKKADKSEVEEMRTEIRLLLLMHLNNYTDPSGDLRRKYGESH